MKYRVILFIFFQFLALFKYLHAQKALEIMQPKIQFDIKLATEMLNSGNAEISGTAFYEGKAPIGFNIGDKWFAKPGTKIYLYPLTPYLKEYLALKSKNKEGKRLATISSLANSYRIEAKVFNNQGAFIIPNLSAGSYYLETEINENLLVFEASGIVDIKSNNEKVAYSLKHTYRKKM